MSFIIKIKDTTKVSIKSLEKSAIMLQHTKENITMIKQKSEYATTSYDMNEIEYGSNKLNSASKTIIYSSKNLLKKRMVKKKIASASVEIDNKIFSRGKQLAQKSAQKTHNIVKKTYTSIKNSIKNILASLKSLIAILTTSGILIFIPILIICLIGLLVGSVFGIFFSSEKTSKDSITMQAVIIECNQEFSEEIEKIREEHSYDEFILDGTMSSWRDVLIIYAVKYSNGNEQEVLTIDENKKDELKKIFWDMNELSYKVKEETVIEKGINELEKPKEVTKNVLRVTIISKTSKQMTKEYKFNSKQMKQYNELLSEEYNSLWNSVIYGMDFGEYTTWRQIDAPWSGIRIGTTTSTISDIGCLVTSIAILIEKSGIDTPNINPFNPGTFVEALNDNGGFSKEGNLQYNEISKIVPDFIYMGKVNLKDKTKEEKFKLISEYYNEGYYITVEVKGATKNNQHWVAVIGINGNCILIVDPASDYTNLWNAYDPNKTSQFNYFRVK